MPDVLLIEPCNFEDFPVGGQLSFAKQMMTSFGSRLALVGISTDNTPIGQWVKKVFGGVEYDYFSVGKRISSAKKPIVPARLIVYLALRRYKGQILSLGVQSAFIRSAESLMAVYAWKWESLCYCFPGVLNPMPGCRYKWARSFGWLFDKILFTSLERVDVILASADQASISGLIERSHGRITRDRVIHFSTRVDTNIFSPTSQASARTSLQIPDNKGPIIVSSGRICIAKGWDLVLDAFAIFLKRYGNAHLYFVGDGEQRPLLEDRIGNLNLCSHVTVTGSVSRERVAQYLNAADVIVVGSRREGWSIAMLEGLACAKPIASTDVSGARAMIIDGQNGFIIKNRQPDLFASAICRALTLGCVEEVSLPLVDKYSVRNLSADLGALWKHLA